MFNGPPSAHRQERSDRTRRGSKNRDLDDSDDSDESDHKMSKKDKRALVNRHRKLQKRAAEANIHFREASRSILPFEAPFTLDDFCSYVVH